MLFPGFRFAVLLTSSVFMFSSCVSPAKKAEDEKKLEAENKQIEQTKDPSFVAFVGRLRKAVVLRDVRTLSTMMTEDFGYSWEPGSDGFGCFQYWDENQLWPELQRVVSAPFLPNTPPARSSALPDKKYFVAPPEFSTNPGYTGFRAGIEEKDGKLKFAYFVPAKEVPMAPPPAAGN